MQRYQYIFLGALLLFGAGLLTFLFLNKELIPPSFLPAQEAVIIESQTPTRGDLPEKAEQIRFRFVEIVESCDHNYQGDCVEIYARPTTESMVVAQVRERTVFKISQEINTDTTTWYKIVFDEWLRYPERVEHDWYVQAQDVELLLDAGVKTSWEDGTTQNTKQIVIDRSEQTLTAYENDNLVMQIAISSGVELSPTPAGTFSIFKKMPSRYMQGPIEGIPGSDYYDLPGVPWNLYFTEQGAVIHGAYWHNNFGNKHSHGCVNLIPSEAKRLYDWAELGTKVIVRD